MFGRPGEIEGGTGLGYCVARIGTLNLGDYQRCSTLPYAYRGLDELLVGNRGWVYDWFGIKLPRRVITVHA